MLHLVLHLLRSIYCPILQLCAVGSTVNHIVSTYICIIIELVLNVYYDCEVCVLIFLFSLFLIALVFVTVKID